MMAKMVMIMTVGEDKDDEDLACPGKFYIACTFHSVRDDSLKILNTFLGSIENMFHCNTMVLSLSLFTRTTGRMTK